MTENIKGPGEEGKKNPEGTEGASEGVQAKTAEAVGEVTENVDQELHRRFIGLIHNNDLDGLCELIESGADVNVRGVDGATLLSEAACGYLEATRILIDAGADVNIKSRNDWGPIFSAVSYTLDYMDRDDKEAVETGQKIVKMLIEAGVEVDQETKKDLEEINRYEEEERRSRERDMKALIEANNTETLQKWSEEEKIDVNMGIDDSELDCAVPALHWAIFRRDINYKYVEVIEVLIELVDDVNAVDEDGNTALHMAAQKFDHHFMNKLIEAGAEVNAKNKSGETPLYTFIQSCQLMRGGFEPLVNDEAYTLIDAGAEIDDKIKNELGVDEIEA